MEPLVTFLKHFVCFYRKQRMAGKIDFTTWGFIGKQVEKALQSYCPARAKIWGINQQDCLWTVNDQFSGKKAMVLNDEVNKESLDIFVIPTLTDLNKNMKTDQFDSE